MNLSTSSRQSITTESPYWPRPGIYRIAQTVEPVVVVGIAPHGEVRIIDSAGRFRTVGEHRVTLRREAVA